MKKTLFIILLIFISFRGNSQNKVIDSLRKLVYSYETNTNYSKDSNYTKILNELAYQYRNSNPDSSLILSRNSITINEQINYEKGLAESYRIAGIALKIKGNYTEALSNYDKAMELAERLNDKKGIAKILNNISNVLNMQGNYSNALENYLKALKIYEDLNDEAGIAVTLNNMAVICDLEKNEKLAETLYLISLKINKKLNEKQRISEIYNNLALIYARNKKFDKALTYNLESLRIREELNDKQGTVLGLINIGIIYNELNNAEKALVYLKKAEEYNNTVGDLSLQALNYQNIAKSLMQLKNVNEALKYANQALEISQKINNKLQIKNSFETLAGIFEIKNDYKTALDYFKFFKNYTDSLVNDETKLKTAQLQAKYEYEKKEELLILEQKRKNLENEKQIQRSYFIRNGFIAAFLFMILITFIILISRQKIKKNKDLLKKRNKEIQKKNITLELQKEEILVQTENLEKANREITAQNNVIQLSHKNITDSINYAKRIQNAVLHHKENIEKLIPQHFILFKPCEIVSGDFYFIKQIRNFRIIAVADCTGHGVPGAFMSMLGITLLNEIVLNKDITSASQVLEELRKQIKNSLQQSGQANEQQDGMDIALCVINLENNKMTFAGAFSPLWLFRQKTIQNGNGADNSEFIELAADNQPVGIYMNEMPFTHKEIQLQPGDTFYMFSDGYLSQFGGEKGEKYKARRFKELLTTIYPLPMEEQNRILENSFNEWKGKEVQTDDVLVMGIRI